MIRRPPELDHLLDHLAEVMPPLTLAEIDALERYQVRMHRKLNGPVDEARLADWFRFRAGLLGLFRLVHGWGDVDCARWLEHQSLPLHEAKS